MSLSITRVGRHRLTRADGTEISQHADLKEAYERASTQPAGTYTLITADERIVVSGVVAPPPPPAPVDCAGTWGPWTRVAGSDGPCVNGSRTYQEARTFTVTTPPANGGAVCPVSPETRTQTEACVVDPPPPPPATGYLSRLLPFAETWARNWNHGGHAVDAQFTANYGFWDYTETTSEPWLFDRATVGHRLFTLTGDTRWRDQFLNDFAWYRQRIDAGGIFTPKGNGDTKYSYVTPFVLYEQLTGDAQYRPIAQRIAAAWVREWPDTFNRGSLFWTEREMAFALEAAVSWRELSGEGDARIAALLNHWDAASIDGVPQVTYTQHEGGGPGGTTPQNLTASPWMAALYFQAARRVGGAQVQAQLSRYADWLDANAFYAGTLAHPQYVGLVFPRYLTGELIGEAGYDTGNMDHALDLAGLLHAALEAKRARGESTTATETRLAQMLATADRSFDAWTRTTTYLPKYRVTPPRRMNWWVRGAYELSR